MREAIHNDSIRYYILRIYDTPCGTLHHNSLGERRCERYLRYSDMAFEVLGRSGDQSDDKGLLKYFGGGVSNRDVMMYPDNVPFIAPYPDL